eukprot:g14198.t1
MPEDYALAQAQGRIAYLENEIKSLRAALPATTSFGSNCCRPFRYCCETRLHKVYPIITIINLIFLAAALNQLALISFNDFFFGVVNTFEECLERTEQVLIGVAALFAIGVVWKFKDRVFEALSFQGSLPCLGLPCPGPWCGERIGNLWRFPGLGDLLVYETFPSFGSLHLEGRGFALSSPTFT